MKIFGKENIILLPRSGSIANPRDHGQMDYFSFSSRGELEVFILYATTLAEKKIYDNHYYSISLKERYSEYWKEKFGKEAEFDLPFVFSKYKENYTIFADGKHCDLSDFASDDSVEDLIREIKKKELEEYKVKMQDHVNYYEREVASCAAKIAILEEELAK